ncbi:MAG: TlpA family protein disulfide reductase [Bacteroidia bacterium]|nr:TlpA family protein disulfide reductase [Bacteroidia bacterium]
MRKLAVLCALLFVSILIFAQDKNSIPSANLKKMDGSSFNTSGIKNPGKPIIINFWATWCKPCIKELTAFAEKYDDWKKETGVIIYAVSIDDSKSSSRVAPFVNGKGWEYEVLMDVNSDFKRAMNVVNVPHMFLVDGKGKIVYQHTTYNDGDENKVYEMLKDLAAGKQIKK